MASSPDSVGPFVDGGPEGDPFLQLSAAVTGYCVSELQATGMTEVYRAQLLLVIGEREAGRLFASVLAVRSDASRFRSAIWDNTRYGPIARSIVSMWLLGTWTQLPRAWRNSYGATAFDVDRVISSAAYREGLIWPAAGAHPMSAKQQGFGSWAQPGKLTVRP